LSTFSTAVFYFPDSALVLLSHPTDGAARIYSMEKNLWNSYDLMPRPGFELLSASFHHFVGP